MDCSTREKIRELEQAARPSRAAMKQMAEKDDRQDAAQEDAGIEFNFEEVDIAEPSVSYHDEATQVVREIEAKIGARLHARLVNWQSPDHRQRAIHRGYQPVKWEHLAKIPSKERAQFVFEKTAEGLVSYRGNMVLMVCKEESYLKREQLQRERTVKQAAEGAESAVREQVERRLEHDLSREDIKGLSMVQKSSLFRAAHQTARSVEVRGAGEDRRVSEEELMPPQK